MTNRKLFQIAPPKPFCFFLAFLLATADASAAAPVVFHPLLPKNLALHRLRTKVTPEETTTYTYDVGSRLSSAADADATLSFVYDALNRVTQATTDLSGALAATTVSYQYDATGNRTRLTYPDSTFIIATYDALNRLNLIKAQSGATIADLGYDAFSRRTQRGLPNTLTTSAYDAVDRLTSLEARNASQTLLTSAASTYDAIGNRQTMTTPDGAHTYGYDLREQLTSADYPSGGPFADVSFTYDKAGNRATVNGTPYTVNPLNQYSSVGGVPFTYDANGNLTSDGTRTYTYDSENRLLTATSAGITASYTYDPFGRRLAKTVNGTTTRFLYDGDQLLVETDGTGTQTASWVYGPGIDEPLRMVRGTITTYYHQDGLGSIILLTAPNTLPVERARYDVFGQVALTDGAGTPLTTSARGNPFTFTGRELDPETGLLYYRARYYDPRLGRFLSRDPLGSLPDTNLYRYVGNNPVNWVDPWGLEKGKSWWQLIDDFFFPPAHAGEEGGPPTPSWWDWYINESVVPGPRGQPLSEWGPHGPTNWGDPLRYTEAAGGAWMWGERAAIGIAATTTAIAVASGTGGFARGGWLNNNPYLRIGWGWKGTATAGKEVFRISIGGRNLPIWWHIPWW